MSVRGFRYMNSLEWLQYHVHGCTWYIRHTSMLWYTFICISSKQYHTHGCIGYIRLVECSTSAITVGSNIRILSTCVKRVGPSIPSYKNIHEQLSVLFYTHLDMVGLYMLKISFAYVLTQLINFRPKSAKFFLQNFAII